MEEKFLQILDNILTKGYRQVNRTEIDTLALPDIQFSHQMNEGFPLLTTRRMPVRSMCAELEMFIKGITSKKWLIDRKCHYWDYWGNPKKVNEKYYSERNRDPISGEEIKTKKQLQLEEDSIGTAYPHQLRRWNEIISEDGEGQLKGVDQLKLLVEKLHKNPNDRRMVVIYYNPSQLEECALPACHYAFHVTVLNNTLNLNYTMRSVDMVLGNNLGMYALLLKLLAKEGGFEEGKLSVTWGNAHIYCNQIEGVKEMLSRTPLELPIANIPSDNWTNIFNWTYEDFELINYNYHPTIKFPIAV